MQNKRGCCSDGQKKYSWQEQTPGSSTRIIALASRRSSWTSAEPKQPSSSASGAAHGFIAAPSGLGGRTALIATSRRILSDALSTNPDEPVPSAPCTAKWVSGRLVGSDPLRSVVSTCTSGAS